MHVCLITRLSNHFCAKAGDHLACGCAGMQACVFVGGRMHTHVRPCDGVSVHKSSCIPGYLRHDPGQVPRRGRGGIHAPQAGGEDSAGQLRKFPRMGSISISMLILASVSGTISFPLGNATSAIFLSIIVWQGGAYYCYYYYYYYCYYYYYDYYTIAITIITISERSPRGAVGEMRVFQKVLFPLKAKVI